MKITATTPKPKFCKRCNRTVEEAIHDQLGEHKRCPDGECLFQEEIDLALKNQKKKTFTFREVKPRCKFIIKPLK